MNTRLPKPLKRMLNALAAQHLGEFLSEEDKRAALEKVLASIDREQYPQRDEITSQSVSNFGKPFQQPF